MSSFSDHPSTRTLKYVCRSAEVLLTARSVVDLLRQKNSKPALLDALKALAARFGASSAYYSSVFRSQGASPSYRFLVACDPAWIRAYEALGAAADDPWLDYAVRHSEPARGSEIPAETDRARSVVALAERHGFRSAAVLPTGSTRMRQTTNALVLGSEIPGFFEDDAFLTLRILARGLAMEFHEHEAMVVRRDWISTAQLSALDLTLLRHEWDGWPTKAIARSTGITARAVDMRFYKLNVKLDSPNRRASAKLAAEHGAI